VKFQLVIKHPFFWFYSGVVAIAGLGIIWYFKISTATTGTHEAESDQSGKQWWNSTTTKNYELKTVSTAMNPDAWRRVLGTVAGHA
jgi:hypothetical protein